MPNDRDEKASKNIMIIIAIAAVCVAAGVGTGVVISKRKFNRNLDKVKDIHVEKVAIDDSLVKEIDRFEELKINLIQVRDNIEKLDIPVPESLTKWDTTETSLNKISAFFEKHSQMSTSTEAFILSVLPISQTGQALWAFAEVAPHLVSDAFTNSLSAVKDGLSNLAVDDVSTILTKFCDGMLNTNPQALSNALAHHNYMGAILKPIKSGVMEITGLHDATSSLSESIHDMSDALGDAVELSINAADFTDLDVSGHIPVITIAISSYREFNLLLDNKTDALTSLKNISLDAAGAGGGGLVGAKAGAMFGSIFGPVGTVIGGIGGGIVGAMGGRAITNNIKQRPLKKAIEEYQNNAELMKEETKEKSRNMLHSINSYSIKKRKEFKEDNILKDIPVVENGDTIIGITLVMFQAINAHINSMREDVRKLKSSFWYSEAKYGIIADNYDKQIADAERQLPPLENIKNNPKLALEVLLSLQLPAQQENPIFKEKFSECSKELKEMNDKNNSSLLVWSYMVNGLYQKALNDIAEYSNNRMKGFNKFVEQWKQTLSTLEYNINVEKDKLGLK